MKLLMTTITITVAVTAVGAERTVAKPQYRKNMSSSEKALCIQKGGKIMRLGLLQAEGCVLPMRDAGKVCSDGSQCQAGSCYADEARPVPPKNPAKGVCPLDNIGFGCGTRVVKGRLTLTMCVD